ncbi:hypothetical protein [uncultured Shewanella sp.]|uniref:hypothetical protein n=1 Tax=uncultured Shewanella sp. TaxID=173975 RepID=UPI00260F3B94|nr:hypothetical protein [uncultured Shewanella sp.]
MKEVLDLNDFLKKSFDDLTSQISDGDKHKYNLTFDEPSKQAGLYFPKKNIETTSHQQVYIPSDKSTSFQNNKANTNLQISSSALREVDDFSENDSKTNELKNNCEKNDLVDSNSNTCIFSLLKMFEDEKLRGFSKNIDLLISLSKKEKLYTSFASNHLRCFRGKLYFHSGWRKSNLLNPYSDLKRDWKRRVGLKMLRVLIHQVTPLFHNTQFILKGISEPDDKLRELIAKQTFITGNGLLTLFKDIMPTHILEQRKRHLTDNPLEYYKMPILNSDYLNRLEYLNIKFDAFNIALTFHTAKRFSASKEYGKEIKSALIQDMQIEIEKVEPICEIMKKSTTYLDDPLQRPITLTTYTDEQDIKRVKEQIRHDRFFIDNVIDSINRHSQYKNV